MIRVETETFYFNLPEELEAAKDFEKIFGNKYYKECYEHIDHPEAISFTKTETKFYSGFTGGKLPAN